MWEEKLTHLWKVGDDNPSDNYGVTFHRISILDAEADPEIIFDEEDAEIFTVNDLALAHHLVSLHNAAIQPSGNPAALPLVEDEGEEG